jgi:hypothetical protein
MSLASNKIILANATTNSAGAFIQVFPQGTATVFPPAGFYYIANTANVTIELNTDTDGNSANASYTVVLANNTAGFFMADGVNVRANVLAGTPTITLFGVNSGNAVTGTYNNK